MLARIVKTLLVVLLSATPVAARPPAAYVVNLGSNTVSVIDLATEMVTGCESRDGFPLIQGASPGRIRPTLPA